MGKFFRNGKLISADTFQIKGFRTLTGATQEQLWGGTATTRPAPSAQQLRLISSSAQDDAGLPDTYTGAVSGTPGVGDIAGLTLNSTLHAYECGADSTTTVAAGVAAAATSGAYDTWKFAFSGTYDAGDVVRTTIGAVQYDWTATGGETGSQAATAVGALLTADPLYDVTVFSSNIKLKKKARGVGSTVTMNRQTDANTSMVITPTQTIAGTAPQTAWTVTSSGANLSIIHAVDGVTTDTAAASYVIGTGTGAMAALTHTVTGGGGSGIRTVQIDGLTSAGLRQSEVISLNGTAAVLTTATNWSAINSITATAVGSGGAAAGTISCTNTGSTSTFGVLSVGQAQTFPGAYKVPASMQAWIVGLQGSASTASEIRIISDCNPVTGAVVSGAAFEWAMTHCGAQANTVSPPQPLGPFPAGCTIYVTGKGASTPIVAACCDGYLEPVTA
jgi:hypothetical protein